MLKGEEPSLCGEADDDGPFGDPGLAHSISLPAFSKGELL